MKTIAITVEGGSIVTIEELQNAPKEGIIIIDWDNIGQADNQEREVEGSLNTFYEVDGVTSWEDFVNDVKKAVK
jgi:hypothetical protein|tara:strand:+ start:2848 stop:3069 length:222 start_codon:yes stop_codon:yes gene_type:complete